MGMKGKVWKMDEGINGRKNDYTRMKIDTKNVMRKSWIKNGMGNKREKERLK